MSIRFFNEATFGLSLEVRPWVLSKAFGFPSESASRCHRTIPSSSTGWRTSCTPLRRWETWRCSWTCHAGLDPASRRRPDESREPSQKLGPGFHREPWIPASAGKTAYRTIMRRLITRGYGSDSRRTWYCQKFYEKPIWNIRNNKQNPPP